VYAGKKVLLCGEWEEFLNYTSEEKGSSDKSSNID
jgi:hypothetical protein